MNGMPALMCGKSVRGRSLLSVSRSIVQVFFHFYWSFVTHLTNLSPEGRYGTIDTRTSFLHRGFRVYSSLLTHIVVPQTL